MSARDHAQALQGHWGIENNLYWQLDVSFGEDNSRIQERNAAENFGVLRKNALSLLKRNPAKKSIARKRKAAALDTAFLEEVLVGPKKVAKI
jgi:predicted transposase YbfD/YdcC